MQVEKTPYFLFKPKVLEKNYKEFESLCEKHIGKYVIAYSVKTNGFPGVLDSLNKLGSNFEVASLDEINLVKGKSGGSLVFNGNCKSEEELRIAIEEKFLINVDSKSEIDRIYNILKGEEFNIGLRVSLVESKFGFEESRLEKAINYCKRRNLNVVSLHFHPGTQKNIRNYYDYLIGVERIVSKILKKFSLSYIDIGGGFPDRLQLKNLRISLDEYFRMISFKLTEKISKKFDLKIILEPGRFLVSDAFELISKVCVIKKNFAKNYAVLDVGINVLSKITLSPYKFSKLVDIKVKKRKGYILAGPLLFGNDVLGRFSGLLEEGDLIKVENVGAYCYNLAWEISYKKPKVFIE